MCSASVAEANNRNCYLSIVIALALVCAWCCGVISSADGDCINIMQIVINIAEPTKKTPRSVHAGLTCSLRQLLQTLLARPICSELATSICTFKGQCTHQLQTLHLACRS